MAGETTITVIGNLTADPELRATNGGTPVVNFTVASTPRKFDKSTNQWVDGTANFFSVKAFGALAEHIARSLTKGMRATVVGAIETDTWVDQNSGQNRSKQVINAEDVSVSLKFGSISGFQRAEANPQGVAQVASPAQPQMNQQQQFAPQVQQQQFAPQVQQAPQVMQPQVAPQVQAAPQMQQVQTSQGMADVQF